MSARSGWRGSSTAAGRRGDHPSVVFFGGVHAAIVSALSQIVTSLRLLRAPSYSRQFRILYLVLYLRLTRLDFRAAMTSPLDLHDGLMPPGPEY